MPGPARHQHHRHRRRRAAARVGRGAHHVLRWLGAIAAVLILVVGFGLWRLMQGPIALDRLTPYVEAALNRSAGGLDIALSGVRIGLDRATRQLDVRIEGVRLARADGEPLAAFPEIRAGFSLGSLLRGRPAPSELVIERPVLRLVRERNGAVSFRFGDQGAGAPGFGLPALMQEAGSSADGRSSPFAALRHVSVRDATLILDDRQTGRRWQANRADVTLRRTAAGLAGDLSLALPIGGRTPELHAGYQYDAAARTVDLSVEIGALYPAALASLDPTLTPLAAIHFPVSGTLVTRIDLTPLRAEGLRLDLAFGKGSFASALLPQGALAIERGEMHAVYAPESSELRLAKLALDLGAGSRLSVEGTLDGLTPQLIAGAAPPPGHLPGKIAIVLSNLPLAGFESLWPRRLSRGGRRWVLANLHDGTIDEATIRLGLDIDPTARSAELASARGTMRYHGLTIDYFDGLTPARNVSGTAVLDGKTLEFTPTGGTVKSVRVTGGSVRISNLGGKTEWLDVDLAIAGPLREVLEVIDEKRLHYAHDIGLDPSRVAGQVAGTLQFKFPLLKDLKLADVDYGVKAKLARVAIAKLAKGRDLTDGSFALDIARSGLQLRGRAQFAGTPAAIEAHRWFHPKGGEKGGVRTRYHLVATLDDTARRRLGLDFFPKRLAGAVGVDLVYSQYASGRADATAQLDLRRARLSLPEAGWRKPADAPATAHLAVTLDGDRIVAVPQFEIGAAGLDGRLALTLDPAAGRIERIGIARLAIAGTELSGAIARGRAGGWRIDVHGANADLSHWFKEFGKSGTSAAARPPPLQIDARFARVVLGKHGELRGVTAQLSRDSDGWRSARIDARFPDGRLLRLRLGGPAGQRRLSFYSDDLGATLGALGITDNVIGGRVQVTGQLAQTDGKTIFRGHIDGADYHLVRAPVVAKILSLASFSAVASMLSGAGIPFSRLRGDFAYAEGRITFDDFLAYGGAIGITAQGEYRPSRDRLDLHGTLVPAYTLNSLIGNVPVLGALLLGGKGQGLFAANYTLAGTSAAPEVTVNPLSALAPGFLRGLMRMKPGTSVPRAKDESKAGY